MRPAVWKARFALLYSLGGWTLLGSLLYHTQTSARREGGDEPETENQPEPSAGPCREVITTNTPIGVQIVTVVTYQEKPETPLARFAYRVRTYFKSQAGGPSES